MWFHIQLKQLTNKLAGQLWALSISCDKNKEGQAPLYLANPFVYRVVRIRHRAGTLLTAMCNITKEVAAPELKAKRKETAGQGTEATRAGIIETLKERGYLDTKGKSLISGRMLIMGLPAEIPLPKRSEVTSPGFLLPNKGKKDMAHRCSVCETRFKDDKGKPRAEIKKIAKLAV